MKKPVLLLGLALLFAAFGLPAADSPAISPAGETLSVTIGLTPFTGDPDACGTETELEVNTGDEVNICYTMTNHGDDTLHYQSLTDSIDGVLLAYEPITLAPGDSHIHVRTVTASGDTTRSASWTGYVSLAEYVFDDTVAPDFLDISETGTDLGFVPGDGHRGGVELVTSEFPIHYYELESDALCVSIDGLILYDDVDCIQPPGSGASQGYYANQDMPTWGGGSMSGMPVLTYIAPMWTSAGDAGWVYYETVGEAPNRRLIIQWHEVESYAIATTTATYQVVFHESDASIRFEYVTTEFGNPSDNGAWATVGLHADPHGLFTKYSYYEPSLSPDSAIEWTYSAPISFNADSNDVQIDAGIPRIATLPEAVIATAAPGTVTTTTLTISNVGERDLSWEIDQAPGRAQAPAGAGAEIPAYATSTVVGLVGLDAADPLAHYETIGGQDNWFFATSFLNNDFDQLYGIIYDSWDYWAGDYGTIDLETGAFSKVGELNSGHGTNWTGLTQDPVTGTVYAANMRFEQDARLYVIDIDTGAVTAIGKIEGPGVHEAGIIPSLAISPEGQMYAIDLIGQQLLRIDQATAQASVVGSLGMNIQYFQDLEFDQVSGDLYWSSFYVTSTGDLVGEMRLLDPSTATSVPIGDPFPPGGNLASTQLATLAIARPAAGCIAPAEIPWLSVSPADGLIPAGAPDQQITVTFDAAGLDYGLHKAVLCISSDDPLQPGVAVPVTLGVNGDMLYDQHIDDTDLHAFNNTIVQPEGTAGMSSEGADDFIVEDSDGWTVSGFSFSAYGNAGNPPPSHISLRVHDDDGGRPGTEIHCFAPGLEAIHFDAPENRIDVWLPGGCELPPGHYWVTWAFDNVNIATPFLGFWGQTTEQFNQPAVWRNPGGMIKAGCTDWSTFDQCPDMFDDSARDFGFTVYGDINDHTPPCDLIFSDRFDDAVGGCATGH